MIPNPLNSQVNPQNTQQPSPAVSLITPPPGLQGTDDEYSSLDQEFQAKIKAEALIKSQAQPQDDKHLSQCLLDCNTHQLVALYNKYQNDPEQTRFISLLEKVIWQIVVDFRSKPIWSAEEIAAIAPLVACSGSATRREILNAFIVKFQSDPIPDPNVIRGFAELIKFISIAPNVDKQTQQLYDHEINNIFNSFRKILTENEMNEDTILTCLAAMNKLLNIMVDQCKTVSISNVTELRKKLKELSEQEENDEIAFRARYAGEAITRILDPKEQLKRTFKVGFDLITKTTSLVTSSIHSGFNPHALFKNVGELLGTIQEVGNLVCDYWKNPWYVNLYYLEKFISTDVEVFQYFLEVLDSQELIEEFLEKKPGFEHENIKWFSYGLIKDLTVLFGRSSPLIQMNIIITLGKIAGEVSVKIIPRQVQPSSQNLNQAQNSTNNTTTQNQNQNPVLNVNSNLSSTYHWPTKGQVYIKNRILKTLEAFSDFLTKQSNDLVKNTPSTSMKVNKQNDLDLFMQRKINETFEEKLKTKKSQETNQQTNQTSGSQNNNNRTDDLTEEEVIAQKQEMIKKMNELISVLTRKIRASLNPLNTSNLSNPQQGAQTATSFDATEGLRKKKKEQKITHKFLNETKKQLYIVKRVVKTKRGRDHENNNPDITVSENSNAGAPKPVFNFNDFAVVICEPSEQVAKEQLSWWERYSNVTMDDEELRLICKTSEIMYLIIEKAYEQKLTSLDYRLELLRREDIRRFSTKEMRENFSNYIEPFFVGRLDELKKEHPNKENLRKAIINFITANKDVALALIQGVSGAGKSLFIATIVNELWRLYAPNQNCIPILITLNQLRNLSNQTLDFFLMEEKKVYFLGNRHLKKRHPRRRTFMCAFNRRV